MQRHKHTFSLYIAFENSLIDTYVVFFYRFQSCPSVKIGLFPFFSISIICTIILCSAVLYQRKNRRKVRNSFSTHHGKTDASVPIACWKSEAHEVYSRHTFSSDVRRYRPLLFSQSAHSL